MNSDTQGEQKNNMEICKAGGFNEAGMVDSLKKKGHDQYTSFGELIDGAADAGSTKQKFIEEEDNLYIADNGKGQELENFRKSWDLGCPTIKNYDEDDERPSLNTKGATGNGTKAALGRLCGDGTVIVYNKHKKGDYLKAIIPFNEIFTKMIWTGSVSICKMNEEDIIIYNKYNQKVGGSKSGWVIQIPLTTEIKTTLKEQFIPDNATKQLSSEKRFAFRYPTEPMDIIYEDEKGELHPLKKYNPFDKNIPYLFESEILAYKVYESNDVIRITYTDEASQEKFIYEGKRTRNGKTRPVFDKTPTGIHCKNNNWKYVGSFEHEIICPVDKKYFDKKNPKMPSSTVKILDYDKEFYDYANRKVKNKNEYVDVQAKEERHNIVRTPIIRNNQVLAWEIMDAAFEYSKCDGGSGVEKTTFQNWFCKDRIKYDTPYAKHGCRNKLDYALTSENVEENKSKFNTENLRPEFKRLVAYNRKRVCTKWWGKWKRL